MTGQQADIQWYIAREGKQHGPLSDAEMRTFVAQGHLKPTDLIWRPGFADWRPAPAVFPFQQPPPPAAPARPAMQGAQGGPARGLAGAGAQPSFEPDRIRVSDDADGGGGSRIKRFALVAVLLALIGGGGWFAWQSGALNMVQDKLSASREGEQVPTVSAPADSSTPPAAPSVAQADVDAGASQLDGKFEQLPAWSVVKREFPDWYNDQLRQAATLTAQNQPQEAVNKHLAEALVALRRQHANEALSASTPRLKDVASAFLANLKSLSTKSVGACYGFISQGETAPAVLEVLQSPEQGAAVQTQIAAIFEAIADGRKSPSPHDRAAKEDYDVLVQELGKLGWKEQDLQVFSNPSMLSREPPERVCQMVQDWFAAHLSIADQGTQERLLVETLKPVVSG
ncbi:DUF4339 domain-containing protein [Hyphomicrobium sp. 1Nfss2.1]|uniref:DUF4339 domain-containing protein n=1 Tax=Hyphomicrobium sp. 1Nfss2.1 TaxID=3413936 RepID=UPI003C7BD603